MSNVLERICDDKREQVRGRKARVPLSTLVDDAERAPTVRGFADRLRHAVSEGRYGLITEIKKASPSVGLIRSDFDPAGLAKAYERGGASCLSVLTDTPYFQGTDDHLSAARASVELPVL